MEINPLSRANGSGDDGRGEVLEALVTPSFHSADRGLLRSGWQSLLRMRQQQGSPKSFSISVIREWFSIHLADRPAAKAVD